EAPVTVWTPKEPPRPAVSCSIARLKPGPACFPRTSPPRRWDVYPRLGTDSSSNRHSISCVVTPARHIERDPRIPWRRVASVGPGAPRPGLRVELALTLVEGVFVVCVITGPRGPHGDGTDRCHRGSPRTTVEERIDVASLRETAEKRYHPRRHQGLSRVFRIISVSVSTRWFIAGSLYS